MNQASGERRELVMKFTQVLCKNGWDFRTWFPPAFSLLSQESIVGCCAFGIKDTN